MKQTIKTTFLSSNDLEEISDLPNTISQLFGNTQSYFSNTSNCFKEWDGILGPKPGLSDYLLNQCSEVHFTDTPTERIVEFNMAGVAKDLIDIRMTKLSIQVSGSRKLPNGLSKEIKATHILGEDHYDFNKEVEGTYENGIVRIVLPKVAEKKINLKVNLK